FVLHHRSDVAVRLTLVRALDAHPLHVLPVRVGIVINVDDLVIPEIDRVGTAGPRAAVKIRIEDLMRERDPSAGRSAGEQARPRLTNRAELFFHGGNGLLTD